jgi:hypothetical protein
MTANSATGVHFAACEGNETAMRESEGSDLWILEIVLPDMAERVRKTLCRAHCVSNIPAFFIRVRAGGSGLKNQKSGKTGVGDWRSRRQRAPHVSRTTHHSDSIFSIDRCVALG